MAAECLWLMLWVVRLHVISQVLLIGRASNLQNMFWSDDMKNSVVIQFLSAN